ncbi:MAG: DUF5682 family protein [Terracidiphilus sp.]|jgi:hypothetical protein
MDERLHLLGIRHHGPGSAALLRQALDALNPACVLIEGPPEADSLIPYAAEVGMEPPVALLLYASEDSSAASFFPFAEFSPEWLALRWALDRRRPARFIDWPAGVSLALSRQEEGENPDAVRASDPLDLLAEAAGYEDGEAFWNALIEQSGGQSGEAGKHALSVFAAIEEAMTAARAHEFEFGAISEADSTRHLRREAFMRTHIRHALKEFEGNIAVVCGAWHLSALRAPSKIADDKALVKDLPRLKVEATWVPWTDSRLSFRSGYGAGVLSPGWYRHLWSLYAASETPTPEHFAAVWQAKTTALLRGEGYPAPTASAIEAARLALGLAAVRGIQLPGLAEMREASLATLCYGDTVALSLIERKLYVGERVGEIDERVPQMPLARDLALWQKRTRLKPEDIDQELRVDLRTDAGLLKSTLLHRLVLIQVPWGRLVDAETGRGTFREVWMLRWIPELSVALAEALIHGVTIEQAAGNWILERAQASSSVTELAEMIRGALVADLSDAATQCIERLQAAAIHASDITDLMKAIAPLVRVLRYGTARKLPENALRALILAMSIEVNAGVRVGSHSLDREAASARVDAMRGYDEALGLFADKTLSHTWRHQLALMVEDDQVAAPIAGLSLRRLHDLRAWELPAVAAAFSRHTSGQEFESAGAFLESFLSGGSEIILQDRSLLQLVDAWLCELREEDFIESLPMLRRSFAGFDAVARRRLIETIAKGAQQDSQAAAAQGIEDDGPFAEALPLLYRILGIGGQP